MVYHLYLGMHNGIRTIDPRSLNERFGSKFRIDSRDRHETPEKDRRTHRPKRYEYKKKIKTVVRVLKIIYVCGGVIEMNPR